MKLQFKPNLDFQRKANHSIVDLFEGQEICLEVVEGITALKEGLKRGGCASSSKIPDSTTTLSRPTPCKFCAKPVSKT